MTERMPRKTKTIVFLLAIAVFAMIITTIAPQFTGYSVQDPNSYDVLIINQNFSSNKQIILPFSEPLTSLHATGTLTGSGTLELILSNGTENYTVYSVDTYSANQLTGFVAKRTEMIMPVPLKPTKSKKTNITKPKNNLTVNSTINSTDLNLTSNISFNETKTNTTLDKYVELNSSLINKTNSTQKKINLSSKNTPIKSSEEYERIFTEHCQDTCWLPSIKNTTLYIKIEGNISLHLQDLSYQLLYPIVQHTNISDQIIMANEVSIINLEDYFNHSNSLIFDLPKIVGINASIINDHQLLLSGNKPGDYRLFVYATNGKDLYRSNEFVVSILPAKNSTLNNKTLIPLDKDLLKQIKENGNARILVKSTNNQFSTKTRRIGIQSTINYNQAKKIKEKKQDVYLMLKEKNEKVKVKQIADDYAAIEINKEQLLSLANQQGVQEIKLDLAYSPLLNDVMNLTNTNLVHEQGWGGAGQKICILDTGAQTQYLNINNSQITAYNIFDDSTNITDTLGHGTAITYAATKIAPDANYVIVKVVDDNGIAYASDIVSALDYCQSQNVSIISISLGSGSYSGYCDQDLVAQKINSINDSLVVVATGNDGMEGNVTSPSCASNALAVGASTKQDELSSITNYNNATLLLAPGENVNTINNQGTYVDVTGTSISTPIVAGVAALTLENNTYSINELKSLLVHTGKIISTPKRYFSRIDSSNALNQYVTNNLSSKNLSLVNGSEEKFKPLSWTAQYTEDFSSALSGWSGETSYFAASGGHLDQTHYDTHVLYRGSSSDSKYQLLAKVHVVSDNQHGGLVFQASSTSSYYACVIDFNWDTKFYLYDTTTVLDSSTHSFNTGDWVYMRAEVDGSSKKCRAWLTTDSEPSTWDVETTDSSRTSGYWGVRGRGSDTEWDDYEYLTYTVDFIDPNVTATKFDGLTTNFSALTSAVVSNLTLENTSYGKIEWYNSINVTNSNYDANVEIGDGFIYVNSTGLSSGHNSSANLTIYNHTYAYPLIYKDGSICSDCVILSETNGNTKFNVTSFSNYTLLSGTNLSIEDTTDAVSKLANDQITFYANYSNVTSNLPIQGSNYYCEFSENETGTWSSLVNMTYNSSSKLYEYNKSFTSVGTFQFNISCYDMSGGYDNLSSIDTFTISPSFPVVQAVKILPNIANYNTNLLGYCNATDINDEQINYYWKWYKNGVENISGSLANQTEGILLNLENISSLNTTYGDSWILSCAADDGSKNSTWVNSSTKKINSTIPVVSLQSPTNYKNDTYFKSNFSVLFNCSITDDYNVVNVTLYISKNGGSFDANESTSLSGTNTYANWTKELTAGVYTWNCLTYDNDSQASWASSNYTYNLSLSPTNLILSDDTDTKLKFQTQEVSFYANYSNASDLLTGSNTYCEFTENSSGSWSTPINMTVSSTQYTISKNFSVSSTQTFNYNISCYTDLNQLNLSNSSNFTIHYTEILPDSEWEIVYFDDFSTDRSEDYLVEGDAYWSVNTTSKKLGYTHYNPSVYYYNGSTYQNDVEVLAKVTTYDGFTGITHCYQNNDYYAAFIDNDASNDRFLWNDKAHNGVAPNGQYTNHAPSLSFPDVSTWWIRIRQNTSGMYMKVWDPSGSEPSNWTSSTTETCPSPGKMGFYGKAADPNTAHYEMFQILKKIVNVAPTTPTSLTPTDGVYNNSVSLFCSGSTDSDNDAVYYDIQSNITGSWVDIVNEDADGNYTWNVSSYGEKSSVDLRCLATDKISDSSYYNPTGTISIDNLAPRLVYNGTNHTITKHDDFVLFNVTFEDANLDTCIFEYYNGSSWSNTTNSSCVSGSVWKVTKTMTGTLGDIINWSWYANDSLGHNNQTKNYNFTLSNSKPTINKVNILPATSYTFNNLRGYCNATDIDGTNLTYYYKWYKNGIINITGKTTKNYTQSTEVNIVNLSNSNTVAGENWTLSCLASNGVENSTWSNYSKQISHYCNIDMNYSLTENLVCANLQIHSGVIVNTSGYNITVSGTTTINGTLNASTGGTIDLNSLTIEDSGTYLATPGNTLVSGNLDINGNYIPDDGDLILDSSPGGDIYSGGSTFYNVIIDNGIQNLHEDLTIENNLDFTNDGKLLTLNTGNSDRTLTFGTSSSSASITGSAGKLNPGTQNFATIIKATNSLYPVQIATDAIDWDNDYGGQKSLIKLNAVNYSVATTTGGEGADITLTGDSYFSDLTISSNDSFSTNAGVDFYADTITDLGTFNTGSGLLSKNNNTYLQINLDSAQSYSLTGSISYANNTGSNIIDARSASNLGNNILQAMWDFANPTKTLRISPTTVYNNDTLFAYCTGSDTDGQAIDYYWKWYNGSSPYSSGSLLNKTGGVEVNLANISNTLTSRNENWTFSCMVSDGIGNSSWSNTSKTILNRPPAISNVTITPLNPTTNDDLNCSVSGWSDLDGDFAHYYFLWYKNNVLNSTVYQTGTSNILASGNLSYNDVWNCSVTPYDGYENGTSLEDVVSIGSYLTIVVNPIFVNSSTAHNFTVRAGAYSSAGSSYIKNTSISTSSGNCFYQSNSSFGDYFNVTYSCFGTPYQTNDLAITFCDVFNQCNTTLTRSNVYPNQAPTMNNLLTPSDGNDSLINRNVSFTWQAGSDLDGDAINYTLNITNAYCADIFEENLTSTSFNNPTELSTYYECQNNLYFWQVKACDLWDCSNYTALWNFSIQDYLEITITNNNMNFSTLDLSDVDDTTDDNPAPFTFENRGNIKANLTDINSTGLWTVATLNSSYYQFKANNATETGSFDWSNSLTNWNNITDTGINSTAIAFLNYDLNNNTAAMDIRVEVPPGEPPGSKTDTLTFKWEAAD